MVIFLHKIDVSKYSYSISSIFRRKINIRGLTFDELLNSILGFSNPGNVQHLLGTLKQNHEASLMRGLHR